MHEATAGAALESCRCRRNRGRQRRARFTERARLWGRLDSHERRQIDLKLLPIPFLLDFASREDCLPSPPLCIEPVSFFLSPLSYFQRVPAPFSFRIRAESIIIFRSCSRRALSFNQSSHCPVLFVY